MWSPTRTRQLFLLTATCIMCTHFTIVYLFLKQNFLVESNDVPISWYHDQPSPLENYNDPHWGADVPFAFEHNLTKVLRELKSHAEKAKNNASITQRKKKIIPKPQYRDLYDNYGGYEYEDVECSDLQPPEDDFDEPQTWQIVVPRKVFVFSAYLEPGKGSPGKVVIIGMGESSMLMDERYYCQLWYRQGDTKVSVVKAKLERVDEHHDTKIVVNFWHCEADVSKDPFAVYVVHRTPCTNEPLNTLLIRNIDESQARTRTYKNFTVCVRPIVNNYNNSKLLVENTEMNILQGASVVVFYQHSTTQLVNNYLSSYKNEEVANVIQWKLPNDHGLQIYKYAQLAALNDCFYRYRYTSRYIIFTDLDEFIIPKKYPSWWQLFQTIHNKSSSEAVFRFGRVLYPLDAPDDETIEEDSLPHTLGLVTQIKTKKYPTQLPRVAFSKYAVVPSYIDMVGVSKPFVMTKGQVKDVGQDDAELHYYSKRYPNELTVRLVNDRTTHLYQKALIQKVLKRHRTVRGRLL